MIREYSSSPDFPRNCAEDLVVRLGLDEKEDESGKNMYGMIERSVRYALGGLGTSSSDFIESLLKGIEFEVSSSFAKTVIGIIIKIAKEKFEKISVKDQLEFTELNARGINWILTVLLNAGVAEELVECFVHLKSIPEILTSDDFMDDGYRYPEGINTMGVVIRIFQEVASGRLPLRTAERVALFRNWLEFLMIYSEVGHGEALKNFFSTLPCEVQIEYVHGNMIDFQYFIDPSSLAKLVKKTLTVLEGTKSRPSLEGHSRQQQQQQGRRDEERRPTVNDETGLRAVKKKKRRRN